MKYLLYLKKSLIRQPKLHLTLYVILTCAFILPLLFSIYIDSSDYGFQQDLLNSSKGETFHIANATEDDCKYFENIEGLSQPYFEEGTIYLHILSDDEWKNEELSISYEMKLKKFLPSDKADTLKITVFTYDSAHGIINDAVSISNQKTLTIIRNSKKITHTIKPEIE